MAATTTTKVSPSGWPAAASSLEPPTRLDTPQRKTPVEGHDLHATMMRLRGINPKKLTYRFQGRDFRLTDVKSHVMEKILA